MSRLNQAHAVEPALPVHRRGPPGEAAEGRRGGAHFGWLQVARLGLVQACLGAVVVTTTSTLNRVMVVELALPALLPGLLVALHYLVQMLRPKLGHGSDITVRRTPWIVGGMAVLAAGGFLAALATVLMGRSAVAGMALAVLAFLLIGVGVGAAGTSLLVVLAKRVAPERRASAATVVWLMMIVGFAVTAGVSGKLLDPYTPARLLQVCGGVCALALAVALLAIRGAETPSAPAAASAADTPRPAFRAALALVWADGDARRFTIFVFVSMLAYSAQDLILEPFAGMVHGYTPGQSTQLAGVQHGGALAGMLLAALAGRRLAGRALGSLRAWVVGGCIASALAMAGLVAAGFIGPAWPLQANVFVLGVSNGAFSIAAIGAMMALASRGAPGQEGVRMGLWGASQAVAFGIGGLLGAAASDLSRRLVTAPGPAYAAVFALEGVLFVVAAALAWRVAVPAPPAPADTVPRRAPLPSANDRGAAT